MRPKKHCEVYCEANVFWIVLIFFAVKLTVSYAHSGQTRLGACSLSLACARARAGMTEGRGRSAAATNGMKEMRNREKKRGQEKEGAKKGEEKKKEIGFEGKKIDEVSALCPIILRSDGRIKGFVSGRDFKRLGSGAEMSLSPSWHFRLILKDEWIESGRIRNYRFVYKNKKQPRGHKGAEHEYEIVKATRPSVLETDS